MKDAAGKVEPAAKDFTSGTVRPAGDYVAENAVPATQAYGKPLGLACGHPAKVKVLAAVLC